MVLDSVYIGEQLSCQLFYPTTVSIWSYQASYPESMVVISHVGLESFYWIQRKVDQTLPNQGITTQAYYIKTGQPYCCYAEGKNMRKKERICVFGSHSGQSCVSYSLPSFSLSSVPLPFFLLTFPVPLPLSLTSGGYLVWLCDSSPAMGQPVFGLDVRLQCVSANVGRKG